MHLSCAFLKVSYFKMQISWLIVLKSSLWQRSKNDALNQLNYTMSRTCPQCEGRIVSTLDTNTRSKEFRRPKPNEQLRKLRPGMWRDEKQAATRMPGSKEAPAQKQGSYAPDGSGHNSQQPATAAKLQLRNSGFPKAKL